MWDVHYWCPACGAPEAFHPEACEIDPREWRYLAAEHAGQLGARVALSLHTQHTGDAHSNTHAIVDVLILTRARRASRR